MKKKTTFLLMLLMCLCSGAWASDDVLFSMSLKSSVTADVKTDNDEAKDKDYALTSYADFGAGSAIYHATSSQNKETKYIGNGDGYKFLIANSVGSCYYVVTTTKAIAAGDVITYKIFDNSSARKIGLLFNTSASTSGAVGVEGSLANTQTTITQTYTVQSTDAIVGATTIYVMRNGGTGHYFNDLKIIRVDPSMSDSDLSLLSETVVLSAASSTYTFTKDTDYETSSAGSFTYTSSAEGVATVTNAGVITAVAPGVATITATQAEAGTWRTGSMEFTVYVAGPQPAMGSTTLDFTNASATKAMLTGTWTNDKPYYGNDGTDNYIVFTPYSAYSSATNQTWVGVSGSGSGRSPFAANDIFGPYSIFKLYGSEAKAIYATVNTSRYYSYRVKGVTKVKLYGSRASGGRILFLSAYPITAGTAAASTTKGVIISDDNNDKVVTLSGLSASQEYLITLTTNSGSNSNAYAVALFYDSATDLGITESITPANDKTTYVTRSCMDFTGLDLKAYVATSTSASEVTLTRVTRVPTATPLVLVGTASTKYDVPVGTNADAVENLLKAGDGKTECGGDGKYDYLLYNGEFCPITTAGAIAQYKAYLHLDSAPAGVRALSVVFDDETTAIETVQSQKAAKDEYFNLAGQRVAQPTKGLYIVNGRKVVIK